MKQSVNKSSSGSVRRGMLILLCALAPIAVGILMPNKVAESGTGPAREQRASAQASGSARQAASGNQQAAWQSGVNLARFDARERSKQRDALRELNSSIPSAVWAELLKRRAEGDEAAFGEFLATITPENAIAAWEIMRNSKLSRDEKGRFYQTMGRVGGGDIVNQLIDLSDRDAALAVRGWAEADPTAALDWFRQLDIRGDQRMQEYLAASSLSEEGFLDRISDSVLNSMNPNPSGADSVESGAAFAEAATQLMESLLEQDPRKGEAMMRELTERFLDIYDSNALSEWFNQLDDPSVQSAAIQRIIESGAFRDDPFQAVNLALSMDDPKTRGNAISAAYGQLGSGAGGVDPGSGGEQIKAMPAGRDRDFVINGFAHGLAGKSPESALRWIDSISNEGFREIVRRDVGRRIARQSGQGGR